MLLMILGTLAIVGVFVGAGMWIDKRVSLMPRAEDLAALGKPKPLGGDHEAGASPHTALRSDAASADRVIDRQRCACKATMVRDGEDEVRYDTRLLRVVRVRCPACSATRSLYFEPRE